MSDQSNHAVNMVKPCKCGKVATHRGMCEECNREYHRKRQARYRRQHKAQVGELEQQVAELQDKLVRCEKELQFYHNWLGDTIIQLRRTG